MQGVILSLRWHVLDSHCEVCHLKIAIIDECVLTLDKDVEKADVDDNPEADDQVQHAHCNRKILPSDCPTPRQVDKLFFALHSNYEARVFFDLAFG